MKTYHHHLGIVNTFKDINTKQILSNMYNADFTEKIGAPAIGISGSIEETSVEDHNILEMMDKKGIKVEAYY